MESNTFMLQLPEGVRLGTEQTNAVCQLLEAAKQQLRYQYPWEGLEEDLSRMARPHIPFMSYGSLLNSQSAAQTLDDDTLHSRQPVIALGVRRIFNYEMSMNGGNYGPPTNDLASAALNVCLTGDIKDAVNGVLVEMTLEDIPALRTREIGYDLEPVVCLSWNELKKPPSLAFILQAPNEPRAGKKRTNPTLKPHRKYYQVCRDGAEEFGESFLNFWLATTFLADGVTAVGKWESTAFP